MRLDQETLNSVKLYIHSWLLQLSQNESIVNRDIEKSSFNVKKNLQKIAWVFQNHRNTYNDIHLFETKYLDFIIQNKHIQIFQSQFPQIKIVKPKLEFISEIIDDTVRVRGLVSRRRRLQCHPLQKGKRTMTHT